MFNRSLRTLGPPLVVAILSQQSCSTGSGAPAEGDASTHQADAGAGAVESRDASGDTSVAADANAAVDGPMDAGVDAIPDTSVDVPSDAALGSDVKLSGDSGGPSSDAKPPGPTGCVRDGTPPVFKSHIVDHGAGAASSGSWGGFVLDPTLPRDAISAFATTISSGSGTKRLSSVDYFLPKSQSVYAPIDGRVVSVTFQNQWWEQDYEIAIEPVKDSHYRVSLDHVLAPTIKAGDTVIAGQKLGSVGNSITNGPTNPIVNSVYGVVELQVNYYPGSSCTDYATTLYECPFQYFSPSLATTLSSQVTQLMSNWEAAKNNTSLFDESTMPYPGCVVREY